MSHKRVYHVRPLENDFKFCQAVEAGDFVFISGCISWDKEGVPQHPTDWRGQLRVIYTELEETLAHFELTFSDVVKETVYCSAMDSMVEAAEVRAEILGDCTPFAATWVEISRLVNADLLVEIEMTAYRGNKC